jgi:hypothetical protein
MNPEEVTEHGRWPPDMALGKRTIADGNANRGRRLARWGQGDVVESWFAF